MSVQLIIEGQLAKYLTAPTYSLGRGADCDILLPEKDSLVSRHHARLERDGVGEWWLCDSSTNGTYVNGLRLTARHRLCDGDQIGIGHTQIGFISTLPAARLAPPPVIPSPAPPTARYPSVSSLTAAPPVPAPAPPTADYPSVSSLTSTPPVPTPAPPTAHYPSVSFLTSPPVAPREEVVLTPAVAPVVVPEPVREEVVLTPAVAPVVVPEPVREEVVLTPAVVPVVPPPLPVISPVVVEEKKTEAPAVQVAATQSEMMRQCTRCRHLYEESEDECPACGHYGFKMKSKTTALTSFAVPYSATEETPFDGAVAAPTAISVPPPVPLSAPSAPPLPVSAPPVPQQVVQAPTAVAPSPPPHVVHHVPPPAPKNSGVALVLSLLITGAGQMYNGQFFKGICLFFCQLFMGMFALIPFIGWLLVLPIIALHIWNIVDAAKTADRINAQAAEKARGNLSG